MTTTWRGQPDHEPAQHGIAGWMRAAVRVPALALLIYFLLVLLWISRIFEWPWRRPISSRITQIACRGSLAILGLSIQAIGKPMKSNGAVVANHSSWIDIFTLNALQRITFVSKSEVASWFGIGILAKSTGTLFIKRDRKYAKNQRDVFLDRLSAGDRLLFFPEGTSSDGQRVLSFNSTLFAAFFDETIRNDIRIQPVTVTYHAPPQEDPRYYSWWGDMGFASHFFSVVGGPPGGRVDIVFHDPVLVRDFEGRKQLASHCHSLIKCGLRLSNR